jgi:hypothetical protein
LLIGLDNDIDMAKGPMWSFQLKEICKKVSVFIYVVKMNEPQFLQQLYKTIRILFGPRKCAAKIFKHVQHMKQNVQQGTNKMIIF